MSKAYEILSNNPEIFACCPNCRAIPFESFMRGQVTRRKYKYFFFGRWAEYCIICRECKEIVGYELAVPWFIVKSQVATTIGPFGDKEKDGPNKRRI